MNATLYSSRRSRHTQDLVIVSVLATRSVIGMLTPSRVQM